MNCRPESQRNDGSKLWSDRKIKVRSTLWAAPRGGAAFAAAYLIPQSCSSLLYFI
jgi:hypothetical protein